MIGGDGLEGHESAVFELSISGGNANLGTPATFVLNIADIVINEIHADPEDTEGDANNDGTVSATGAAEDEFIEIVNVAENLLDIGNCSLSDAGEVRHVFPEGTVLEADQAIIVVGDGSPQGNFGGALVQVATSGGLSINNGDETITLRDADNNIVLQESRDMGGNVNQSLTRDPDLTGAFVQHTEAVEGVLFSPGTKVDGTSFGGGDPDAIVTVIKNDGDPGWRMLSAPVGGVTVGDLAAQNLVQGISDEYPDGDVNLYSSYDGTAFVAPASESTELTSGEGFIWFFFDIAYDPADAGITNGDGESFPLPSMLQASGTEPGDVTVMLDNPPDPNNDNERWELLGNPFDEAIDVAQITANGGSLVSQVGQVWEPAGAGAYVLTTDAAPTAASGNELAIWQGAFFQNNDATSVTIPTSAKLGVGSPFYGRQRGDAERGRIVFELSSYDEDGEQASFDRAIVLYFSDDVTDTWDLLDATKLTPLRSQYATLAFVGERKGNEVLKAQESRPIDGSSFEVALAFEAVGVGGTFTLQWPRWDNVPEEWSITLTDAETEAVVDLRAETAYTFVAAAGREVEPEEGLATPEARSMKRRAEARFILSVARIATDTDAGSTVPATFGLKDAYPNPFAATTTVRYDVARASDVHLVVYDLLGRVVATLAEGPHEAGRYTATLAGTDLSDGIYFIRMTAEGFAATKKVVVLN